MFSDKKNSTEDLSKEQNKIAQGTSFKGDVESKGSFRIEGYLNGSIKTNGKVVIGKTGEVEGDIECENADLEGSFKGSLSVNAALSLRSTANVNGEVTVDKLSIEPGAVFNATCVMKGSVKDLSSESKKSKKGFFKEGQTA